MIAIQKKIYKAAQDLRALTPHPEREARLLMAFALNLSYEEVYLKTEREMASEEEDQFNALVQRRLKREPLSKIKECREFWSLPFRVTRDTLDPRPDSETLIEAVIACCPEKMRPWRILDLGTGTGCLLLSLLREYPNAWGIGIDRSEAASAVAKENATRLNLHQRSVFMAGNWGDALTGAFDVIVSNPPYIADHEALPPEVALYEPKLALYGGQDGLDCYRAIAAHIPRLSTPDSKVFLEVGAGQLDAVSAIFSYAKSAFAAPDLSNQDRCLILFV